jgi:hypothetical protein
MEVIKTDIKDILFKRVICTAFLKKVHDGKFISVSKDDIDEAMYCNTDNPENFTMSECSGDHDFLKTYYEVKERPFTGIIVGIKDVIVTAWLVADTNYDYAGREYLRISRDTEKKIKCAVVYYRNNCKRYVPLDNVKVGE